MNGYAREVLLALLATCVAVQLACRRVEVYEVHLQARDRTAAAALDGSRVLRPAPPTSAPPTSIDTCQRDSDCMRVDADCCGCSQGGGARAIQTAQLARHEREQKAACGETLCAQMFSNDPTCGQVPRCRAGRCVLVAEH